MITHFKLTTLIDITQTGARKGDDEKAVKQQQNYMTMMGTLGLRVNPTVNEKPSISTCTGKFGTAYKKETRCWEFRFSIEYDKALSLDMLLEDFNGIPILLDLDENVKTPPMFITQDDKTKNIVFEILE